MGAPGAMTKAIPDPHDVVLFDGVCNLCNASVRFIINRDSRGRFKFASLQSVVAKQILKEIGVDTDALSTIVLIRQERCYVRSDAILEIARKLDGIWPLIYAARIIPRFIRDGVYRLIARHRYSWFGKKDSCMVPTPDLKTRFLE